MIGVLVFYAVGLTLILGVAYAVMRARERPQRTREPGRVRRFIAWLDKALPSVGD